MKLDKLLENEDNIGQLKVSYPFIETTLIDPYFITDLPSSITKEQLQQLCKISLPPRLFSILYPLNHGITSWQFPSRVTLVTGDEVDRKITAYGLRHKRHNRDKWCKTWAELVELIFKEYSFGSNDFED